MPSSIIRPLQPALLAIAVSLCALPLAPHAQSADPLDAGAQHAEGQSLASKATDPTAPLMSFKLITGYTGAFYGPDIPSERDDRWTESFRLAVPFAVQIALSARIQSWGCQGCLVIDEGSSHESARAATG